MDRTLWPSILLCLVLFGIFEATGVDLWVQDYLYNFQTHAWLVDAKSAWPRLLFYTGPKALLWICGVLLFGLACAPSHWRARLPLPGLKRRDLWVTVGTLALAPLLVGIGKAATNVFTPNQTRHYGGFAPYVKVLEDYPVADHPKKRGRGFPAGHASGGFALMALSGLAATRRGRAVGVAVGLTVGWMMGLYQMLKGAHYLSHTVLTALFCWIVFLGLRRALKPAQPEP
jgi:membrane-associated PAP2 superfamily phosphatase